MLVLAALVVALAWITTASAHPQSLKAKPKSHRVHAVLNDVKIGRSKPALQAQVTHSTHVIAFFTGGKGAWMPALRHSSCRTVPWRTTCVAARKTLRAHRWLRRRAHELIGVLYPPPPPPPPPAPAVDGCLSELIQRESGWRVTATNPDTGAYGLPQALPGSKMASAGSDWATNPATQIRWMLGYVQQYGGSCGALAHQIAYGSY